MNLALLIVVTIVLAGLGSYFTVRSALGVVAWILMIQPWGFFLFGRLDLLPTLAIDAGGVALFYLLKQRTHRHAV